MDTLDRTLIALVLFGTALHAWHMKPAEPVAAAPAPAPVVKSHIARRPNSGTMVERWADFEFNHRWDGAR